MEAIEFAKRLTELRENKGVSAREMSLSIGLDAGYINNIENCHNYPSMENFFYICDYLGITPAQFFTLEVNAPDRVNNLTRLAESLNVKQLDAFITLIDVMKQ